MKVMRVNSTTQLPAPERTLDQHTDMAQTRVHLTWYANVLIQPISAQGRPVRIPDLWCVERHQHGTSGAVERHGYTTLDEARTHYARDTAGMQRPPYLNESRF